MRPPAIPEQQTPVLTEDDLRALLKGCDGKGFAERRDIAILRLFLEPGGLRLAELTALAVNDVDLERDVVAVLGKGRRQRTVPFTARTGQALTRYLRLRDRHAGADSPRLWLGGTGAPMTDSGIYQMVERRAQAAGLGHVHPHQLRHTAAHVWFAAGGGENDAMRLFGWRSRQMLARYAAATADDRAHDAARRLALGDRL
jgi:integrase/recombinase XerC